MEAFRLPRQEPISIMPQQNAQTPELDEAQIVLGVALPACDQAAVVVEPRKQTFDLPAPFRSSQRAAVLGRSDAVASMRGDQLDVPFSLELLVQPIAVVGAISDQSADGIGKERVVESLFDERDLVRRSTCDANGDWKTKRVCDCHDLGSLAALRLSDGEAPFLAPAKEPSMKASERSMPPRS